MTMPATVIVAASQEPSRATTPSGPKPGPPRNVTITRVAQGYAISWSPPLNKTVPVAYYYIEYKIGQGDASWKTWGPIAKETSYLAKHLKAGETYFFRVFAHSILGAGQPSDEARFDVPGGISKQSKDKAIVAGVVGGILFFIAAIVLSVCTVKICNKRKRRKAEKAYMMVTCPIMDARNGGHSQGGSPVSLKQPAESRVSSLVSCTANYLIQRLCSGNDSLRRAAEPRTVTGRSCSPVVPLEGYKIYSVCEPFHRNHVNDKYYTHGLQPRFQCTLV